MKKTRKFFGALALMLMSLGLVTTVGCADNDGPAEELGEEIDDAADEVEDAID